MKLNLLTLPVHHALTRHGPDHVDCRYLPEPLIFRAIGTSPALTRHQTGDTIMTATPRTVRAIRTMARIGHDDAAARYERQRRAAARSAGYRGPLTRSEASARQLARLNRSSRKTAS